MEAGELASHMFLACAFATLLQHTALPIRHLVADSLFRRMLYGLANGASAIAIVMSPWGKQSGGHFNPAPKDCREIASGLREKEGPKILNAFCSSGKQARWISASDMRGYS